MKVTKLGALAVGASLVLGACSQGASTAPGSGGVATKGTVNIAIELPQQGSDLASSEPMINGIKLAVKDAGGVAGSYKIEIPNSAIFDDAKDGAHDPQTGAQNTRRRTSTSSTTPRRSVRSSPTTSRSTSKPTAARSWLATACPRRRPTTAPS